MKNKRLLDRLPENKHISAGLILAMWTVLCGTMIFVSGNVLENILLFIIAYNMLYPVITAVFCYIFSKEYGISFLLCGGIITLSVISFVFTELIRYAMPNIIVMTIIIVFFASGIGNVMGGDDGPGEKGKGKKKKDKSYKNILDD